MKIKRYFAPDMRQAIRKVREEQGPDAVILSNRRVNGGIEIIAAVDYDESLFGQVAQDRAPAVAAPEPAADDGVERENTPAPAASAGVEWAQDPVLMEMRQEIRSLRGLLENQLSHLAWGDLARSNPLRAGVLQRFRDMSLGSDLSQQLAEQVHEADDLEHAWRQALARLAHRIDVTDDDILTRGGVVSLVGPTGVGKTTMVAKLAARYALRHGKRHVALVSTDSFRIGAHEQLQTFGQLLGVSVYSAPDSDSLSKVLTDLADKHLVLIDTAGMSQRDIRLSEQLATLQHVDREILTYLVLSANIHGSTADEVVRTFRRVPLHGCILTKLDESACLGGPLSAVIRYRLPVAYVGDGQRVPEDVHPARAHSLVSRAVALMQQAESCSVLSTIDESYGKMANAHV
ncbi:MAG: flagellar biosynthesis protein FlhF [Gammaproteobacteria bacterium]